MKGAGTRRARVVVTLRPGILDPAGKAVLGGLAALGFDEVRDVRLGKFIEIELNDGPDASDRLQQMCQKMLANPVIEDFRIELED